MAHHTGPLTAKRILVYGVTGAGKTTFARKLSEVTGIPWHSVDDLTWKPNWVQTTVEFQREKFTEICGHSEWILDTAYGTWLDIPLSRAEVIVALDYPRWFSMMRLARRTLARLVDRRPICNGNRESLKGMFSRDSILAWHFKSFARKRDRIRQWAKASDGPALISFRHARDADGWLRTLKL